MVLNYILVGCPCYVMITAISVKSRCNMTHCLPVGVGWDIMCVWLNLRTYTDLFKVSCRGELDARIRSPPWFCSGNWLVSWTHLEHLIPLTDSVASVHPRPQCIWVAAGLASAQSMNCIPLAWSAYCIGCLPLRECTWYKGTSCIGWKFIFSTSISFRWSGYLGGTTGNGEIPWWSINPL